MKSERGQSSLEFAVMAPLLALLLSVVVDMGGFAVQASATSSAADTVARALEETPALSDSDAVVLAQDSQPSLRGHVDVSVENAGREEINVDYKIHNPIDATFKTRPSVVARERYEVKVTYTGSWMSPVIMAASAFSNGDGTYTAQATSIATVDATMETW